MACREARVPAKEPVALDQPLAMQRHFRLQYEEAQQNWVVLYPEGMVKLGTSSGEIMKRIDGKTSAEDLIRALEAAFPGADLRADVLDFLREAHERGWIGTSA